MCQSTVYECGRMPEPSYLFFDNSNAVTLFETSCSCESRQFVWVGTKRSEFGARVWTVGKAGLDIRIQWGSAVGES